MQSSTTKIFDQSLFIIQRKIRSPCMYTSGPAAGLIITGLILMVIGWNEQVCGVFMDFIKEAFRSKF